MLTTIYDLTGIRKKWYSKWNAEMKRNFFEEAYEDDDE